MKNNILDMEALEDRLRYWQQRLRLMDWTILIMYERGYNLAGAAARINVYEDKRLARILMIEPGDYDPTNLIPYDMEQTLVHEMLHIHFWPLTRDIDGNVIAEEQAIEAIAWGLVGLDRRAEEIENYYMGQLYPPGPPKALMHVSYNDGPEGRLD